MARSTVRFVVMPGSVGGHPLASAGPGLYDWALLTSEPPHGGSLRATAWGTGRSLRPRARARPRRDGDGLPGQRSEAPPPGRRQGLETRARGGARPRAISPRDRDRGRPHPPAYPAAPRLGPGRGVPLLRDAVRGGRIAAGPPGA